MGDISAHIDMWPKYFDGPIGFPGINLIVNPPETFFGTRIHWYGVIIAIGLLIAVAVCLKLSAKHGVSKDNILDIVIYGIPSAIICARLYYVAFRWDSYSSNLSDIFKIWEGGIAIYGAIIGAVITAILYCRFKKISFFKLADVCSIGLTIGQSIGRWGNFVNREAFGSPTGKSLPWRMRLFTDATLKTWVDVHPAFLYESLWNVGVLILILNVLKKKKYDGQVFWTYLTCYGLGRLWIEALRTDSLYLGAFRISQVVALVTVVLGTLMLVVLSKKVKNTQHNL